MTKAEKYRRKAERCKQRREKLREVLLAEGWQKTQILAELRKRHPHPNIANRRPVQGPKLPRQRCFCGRPDCRICRHRKNAASSRARLAKREPDTGNVWDDTLVFREIGPAVGEVYMMDIAEAGRMASSHYTTPRSGLVRG